MSPRKTLKKYVKKGKGGCMCTNIFTGPSKKRKSRKSIGGKKRTSATSKRRLKGGSYSGVASFQDGIHESNAHAQMFNVNAGGTADASSAINQMSTRLVGDIIV